MALTDGHGRNIPFFVDYYEKHTISTEDFSPSEDASLTASEIGTYMDKGFLVRPNADGDLYGITLYDYERNINPITQLPYLTGIVPEPFYGLANTWIECKFVKVYSSNSNASPYETTATAITVGITI